jgi:uncharacterized pyridoxal phosphate-containing UPF0001 family protein
MTSHASTRSNNLMYGHPSLRDLRAKERGETKPLGPVAAKKAHYRAEWAKMIASIDQEKVRDPLDRKAHLADAKRKKLAEECKTEREEFEARRDRDIEETSRMHPVA